jgi:uncharacterized protein YfbU (UPF0304 family)
MRIKLTDSDRLILSNQYEILGELKNDEGYAAKRNSCGTVTNGYTAISNLLVR